MVNYMKSSLKDDPSVCGPIFDSISNTLDFYKNNEELKTLTLEKVVQEIKSRKTRGSNFSPAVILRKIKLLSILLITFITDTKAY